MRRLLSVAAMVVLAITVDARAQSQSPPPTTGNSVSREEYDKLKAEQDALRKELEELKRERASPVVPLPAPAPAATQPQAAPAQPQPAEDEIDELHKEVKGLREDVARYKPGTSQFFIAGDMDVGFSSVRHEPSTFSAGLAPLILYRPTDRILIEGAADIGIDTDTDNNSSTSFDLTIANISFLVNDNLAVGGGLFVVPFGTFHNHFDPPWINKFPDEPLPFGDNPIAPGSEVGFFARGAVPAGSTKIVYDAYVTNGPNLITKDPDAAGSLNFDDFTDLNNNKAVGGRIGFLPVPNVEIGYSIEAAEVNPQDFKRLHALLQGVDANWRQECPFLQGQFDIRGEWVWSDVGRATYDPTGALGFGPTTFSNFRDGGYLQVCYRPTKVDNPIIRNLEFCTRYDILRTPLSAPGGDHEQRYTFGINYWITPAIVLKTAYEIDDKEVGENQDAFLIQIGIGL